MTKTCPLCKRVTGACATFEATWCATSGDADCTWLFQKHVRNGVAWLGTFPSTYSGTETTVLPLDPRDWRIFT